MLPRSFRPTMVAKAGQNGASLPDSAPAQLDHVNAPGSVGELADERRHLYASGVQVGDQRVGGRRFDGYEQTARGLGIRQHQSLGLTESLGPVHEPLD